MNNSAKKVLSVALAAAMLLSACGNTQAPAETPATSTPATSTTEAAPAETKKETKPVEDLYMYQTHANELDTFNVLYSQSQSSSDVLCNLVDGLLEVDPDGKLIPCLAEEWGTEDGGVTWTFKLREGIKWVDVNGNEKADCTAEDFLVGLEWVLNAKKNEAANVSMPAEMIVGAQEYYDYTNGLSDEEAEALNAGEGSKFRELVGIEAVDAHTIVYHCVSEKPYFDSLGAYNCLYPMAQGMVDELGSVAAVKAMDNTQMWYNGAYILVSHVANNEKRMEQNPTYWDTESTRFNSVTVKMVDSVEVAYQLFQNGELDYVQLSESTLNTILADPNHDYYNYLVENKPTKYSWQMYWNYNKHNEDGSVDVNFNTAVANEAFRKSIVHGWDTTEYLRRQNTVNPMKCENLVYTMQGLCYTSDGKDYTDLVKEKLGIAGKQNGETLVNYSKELGDSYKAQAIEELTALGVTFPVVIDYYISGSNQTALDTANVLKNSLESSLGSDYVSLNIKTYVSSFTKEVRNAKLHGMYISGWGADYGDPMNYMSQEIVDYANAYYAVNFRNADDIFENGPTEATEDLYNKLVEFTDMVKAADAITDLDARYDAFADAEAFLIDHALTHPLYYQIQWTLTKVNPYSKPYAMFGSANGKYKNWETNADGYTTEEIAEIAANA